MTDPFDGPGSASNMIWENYAGRLMLITPHSRELGIKTVVGVKDAIRADVAVLDGPGAPEDIRDVLIFPLVLQGQVRANIGTGRMNLGRLGQGDKKPGQNAPWQLADPTDVDKALARAHLAGSASSTAPPF